MMAKTIAFILTLSLALGVMAMRYDAQIAKKIKPGSPEIFKVSRDTIHVAIDGRLHKALLVNNKYYAFYEVRDSMSSPDIKKFYIIAKNGKIEKEIKVPNGIYQDIYSRLYFSHGRIMVNTESYDNNINTYYLDEDKGEFVKNSAFIKFPLLEDENELVTSECKGEWGSTIYFDNKQTKAHYSFRWDCPFLINKLGGKYYINTSGTPYSVIEEIDDPSKIKVTAFTIFQYDIMSNFKIPTSFVAKDVLYHIYNSSHDDIQLDEKVERVVVKNDTVKIGPITNGKFKSIYRLKDRIDIEFQQRLSPEHQICIFHTEERVEIGFKTDNPPYREAKYGVIEIIGNEIRIHYFISKKAG